MKKVVIALLILASLSVTQSTFAQQRQYESICPNGTTPSNDPQGTTFDSVTGKYRQWLCMDPFGNVAVNPIMISLPLTTSSTIGAFYLGQFSFLSNYPGTTFPSNTGQNTYVGVNAGNFTLGKAPLWQPSTVYRLGQGGTANSSGTTITWVGQDQFVTGTTWNGATIFFNQTPYIISSVTDATHLVLTTSAGTQTNQPYFVATSQVTDPSGHTQKVTTGGTSQSPGPPAWNDAGGSTTDGTVTWHDQGNGPAGAYNTGIGELALTNCATCWVEVALGQSALYSDTSGVDNTAVGGTALFSNTDGFQNTAMGFDALFLNNHGFGNTALGSNTLVSSTGNYNTAVGLDALFDLSGLGSVNNVAVGLNAGYNPGGPQLVTATNNTFVGAGATSSIASPANSAAIGAGASVNSNNQIVIGNASVTDVFFGSTGAKATGHFGPIATSLIYITNLLVSRTAPTIAAAGCGGTNSTISAANGTGSFEILIGSGGATAGGCTITMPAAVTSWTCDANDTAIKSATNFYVTQTGAISRTSVTIQNFSDAAVATAFAANDTIRVKCSAN